MGNVLDPKTLWAGRMHEGRNPVLLAAIVGVATLLLALIIWIVEDPSPLVTRTIEGREVASGLRANLRTQPGAGMTTSGITCARGNYQSGDTVRCRSPRSGAGSAAVHLLVTVTWKDGQWHFDVDVA